MAQLQKCLRDILQDQSEPKPVKMCIVRDMETFYSNSEQKKKVLCKYFQKGDCNKGSSCSYSHDKDLIKQQRFKVQLCKNFEQSGSCKYKDGCTFAHGRSELRHK